MLLVGHGTRDALGTRQFFELGQRLADQLSPAPVASCLLEFQEPTIPQAWDQLAALGVQHIHVAPLLLFAAGHAKRDIPDLVAQCHTRTPNIGVDQSGPLSRHRAMIELVQQRIGEVDRTVDRSKSALVMVGRGSFDPCAQADMRVLTEVVAWRMGFAHTTTAFYAMAEPRLPEMLDRVAAMDGIETIIVQPHLLFAGRLFDAISQQIAEASARHRDRRFLTTAYLGPECQIATAIAGRLKMTPQPNVP
ncbi:MAG: sirohydrochlorin chelatase [Pirellulaceae bacterium]|nr:sirohydrochlorin chelatase [Pirellulaceae bacterium]